MRLLIAITVLLSLSTQVQAQTPDDAQEQIRKSLVYLEAAAETENGAPLHSTATGFIVDAEGQVLTVYHLIRKLEEQAKALNQGKIIPGSIEIRAHPGSKHAAQIKADYVKDDQVRDLLVLDLPSVPERYVAACVRTDFDPRSQEDVFTAGFPDNGDVDYITDAGKITSPDGPNRTWITRMVINPGQSGSPIFTSSGGVVGIAKGQMRGSDNAPAEGQYVVLPIEDAQQVSNLTSCTHLAGSILSGVVIDAITRRPVGGAQVQIEYSDKVVGSGTSDIHGNYSISFTIPRSAPASVMMKVLASSESHEQRSVNFQVSDGTPTEHPEIPLYEVGVMNCLPPPDRPRSVIVGHFLPPSDRDLSNLAERVAGALAFAVNTRLQAVKLPPKSQPSFLHCDAANPNPVELGKSYAKKLQADAFVNGSVAGETPNFTVSTYISDAYDLFDTPSTVTSRGVDLDVPSAASIAGNAQVAVLAAIAAGFVKANNCVAAQTVLSVAEQMVTETAPYIDELKKTCEARLPNRGLMVTSP